MKIEVGKFYRGTTNNCLIQIMAIKEESSINPKPNVVAYYIDARTNKVSSAQLNRLEHSHFEEVSPEDVMKEVKKHDSTIWYLHWLWATQGHYCS